MAKEHRFGRWKVCKAVRNGGVVFEVPRIQKAVVNGDGASEEGTSDDDEDE